MELKLIHLHTRHVQYSDPACKMEYTTSSLSLRVLCYAINNYASQKKCKNLFALAFNRVTNKKTTDHPQQAMTAIAEKMQCNIFAIF